MTVAVAPICSFCRRSEDEALVLVAGPGALLICDHCVDLTAEAVSEHRARLRDGATATSEPFDPEQRRTIAQIAGAVALEVERHQTRVFLSDFETALEWAVLKGSAAEQGSASD